MGGPKEYFFMFGNHKRENISFTLNAGETMICNFKTNLADSSSNKYFNLGDTAKKVAITVNKIASITKINNQELKSPRTLGTASVNIWSSGIEWSTIVVRADINSTVFEIYAS